MSAWIFIFALFIPIAFLPSVLEGLFSACELTEMGIRIEDYHR